MRAESLRDLLAIFWRRGLEGAIVALAAAFAVVAVGLRLPRTYVARALVDVKTEQPTPLSGVPTLVQTALGGSDTALLQTIAQRLTTRSLVATARQEFARRYPQAAAALPPTPQLVGQIRAGVESGSRLLSVQVTLREDQGGPRAAALFANQLIETFRRIRAAELAEEQVERAVLQLRQLETVQSELEAQLAQVQEEVVQFVQEAGGPSTWDAELTYLLDQKAALLEMRRSAQQRQAAAEALIQAARERVPQEPEYRPSGYSLSSHPLRRTLEEEAAKYLAQDAQQAAAGLTEETPERRGLRAAAEALRAQAEQLPQTETVQSYQVNPLREELVQRQLVSELARAQTTREIELVDTLLSRIEEQLQQRLHEMPTLQVRLANLRQRASILQEVYQAMLVQHAQLQWTLREALARRERSTDRKGEVALIDPAVPELRPVRPRVGLFVGVGAVLGLLFGAGVALALEWWQDDAGSGALVSL